LFIVCRDAGLQSKTLLADDVDGLVRQLVQNEVSEVCRRCRLTDVLQLIQAASGPLSTIRGLEPDLMRAAIKRFETVLLGSGPIVTPLCDLLQNPELKQRARQGVADGLAKTYGTLFDVVTNPGNGYDSTGSMFKHTPSLLRDTIMV
jgi:hypothetical protein